MIGRVIVETGEHVDEPMEVLRLWHAVIARAPDGVGPVDWAARASGVPRSRIHRARAVRNQLAHPVPGREPTPDQVSAAAQILREVLRGLPRPAAPPLQATSTGAAAPCEPLRSETRPAEAPDHAPTADAAATEPPVAHPPVVRPAEEPAPDDGRSRPEVAAAAALPPEQATTQHPEAPLDPTPGRYRRRRLRRLGLPSPRRVATVAVAAVPVLVGVWFLAVVLSGHATVGDAISLAIVAVVAVLMIRFIAYALGGLLLITTLIGAVSHNWAPFVWVLVASAVAGAIAAALFRYADDVV